MATILHLMRHGHVHNPTHILYGRMPGFFLSEDGVAQARAAGEFLAGRPIAAVYSSPMERARQTADIVASYHEDMKPQVTDDLIEVSTPYEGHPTAELAAKGWDLYTGNEPPFETPAVVLARVLRFFQDARERHAGEEIVAVSHGDILVFSWLHAHGFVPEALMKDNLRSYKLPVDYPETASILRFELSDAEMKVSYSCPWQ